MSQISIFDGSQPFEINKPVRLIELFAGIGAQAKALERLGIEFEPYKISEWDVFANCSYRAVHCYEDTADHSQGLTAVQVEKELNRRGISCNGKDPLTPEKLAAKSEKWKREVYSNMVATHNIGSIVNASGDDLEITETDKYIYLVTYSFPCQDLSPAGKMRGMARGAGTRSGLLWEFERVLCECQELPQILLMENVPEVCGRKNIDAFAQWLDSLEALGYHNYYKVQNALEYGVAQNRERCFMVSLLGDYYYTFPAAVPLTSCVLDYLEERVDDKYYLTPKSLEVYLTHSAFLKSHAISGGGYIKTFRASPTTTSPVVSPFVYAPADCRVQNTKNGLILPGGYIPLKVYAPLCTPFPAAGWKQKYLSARQQKKDLRRSPRGGS